jgi:hypothetical protein
MKIDCPIFMNTIHHADPQIVEIINIFSLAKKKSMSKDVLFYIDALFAAATKCSHCPLNILESISHFVKDLACEHPSICQIVLSYLPNFENPRPLISILSPMLCLASKDIIEYALLQLIVLFGLDTQFHISVIGAIFELHVPQSLKVEITNLAITAIKSVDELDFPVLFRLVLKGLSQLNAIELINELRYEV